MENLYVGTSSGEIFHINVQDRENPFLAEMVRVSDKAVTALGFYWGHLPCRWRPIWQREYLDAGKGCGIAFRLGPEKIHTLKSHNAPVIAIAPSMRDTRAL
ncbi:MAG: hypothetical protein HS132_02430 [Planctomycetia bacterium]|nr:hypothetical protein [Planctomycetia bacterium]